MTRFAKTRIPDDWDGASWRMAVICVPDSLGWRSIVRGAIYQLTRGRNYDARYGTIKDAQKIGVEILESLDMTCGEELTRIADTLDDMRAVLAPPTFEHTYLEYFQELEALGGSVASGDTIMVSLQKMVDRMPTDMTLQEMIDQMEIANDPDFKDLLEMLHYLKAILPNLPNIKLPSLISIATWLFDMRHKHTHSATMVLQAQHLWGIQNSLTAFSQDEGDGQEEAISELWETLQNTPWIATAIGALVDPSPAGEAAFAAKVVGAAVQVFERVTSWWENFRNSYINQIEEPIPVSTVTGQLAEIAARLQNLDTGSSEGGLGDLTSIVDALTAGMSDINQSIEEDMMITQSNVQTVNCGTGGGCSGTTVNGYFIPDENPAGSAADNPAYTLPNGSSVPSGFEGQEDYALYKCKAANSLFLKITEGLYQISEIVNFDTRGVNFSTTLRNVLLWLRGLNDGYFGWLDQQTTTLHEVIIGWIGDPLALFSHSGDPANGISALQDVRLHMLSNRQEFVCVMFNTLSTDDARNEILDMVDDYLDTTSYAENVKEWTEDIIKALLTNGVLSALFSEDSTFSQYDDITAIDCALCSEYVYPAGTCMASAGSGYSPENGQGNQDGVETEPMPEDSYWEITFSSAIEIVSGMELSCYCGLASGTYQSFYVYAIIDGTPEGIKTDHDQVEKEWRGGSLNLWVGADLEGARVYGAGEIAQSPTFIVDGCRVKGSVI